jgi:hypothetical protein
MGARRLSALLVTFVVFVLGCEVGHGDENDHLTTRFLNTAAMIEAAFHTQDVDELYKIKAQINAFVLLPGESNLKWRNKKLELWLNAIQKAHSAIDPSLSVGGAPEINIAPKSAGGVVYDSGVDPKSIKDPDVREDYERRLAENSRKAQVYLRQHTLRQLEANWTTEMKAHVSGQYSGSNSDKEEISSTLNAVIVDVHLREQLLGALL